MLTKVFNWPWLLIQDFLVISDQDESPRRYKILHRNMILIMIFVTILPLFLMAFINYHQYQRVLKREIIIPMGTLVNKTKHSFELFLTERLSAVSFIARTYSYEELDDQDEINRIFQVMKHVFGGFVDLGLIDASGLQVSYAGPYELKGKRYKEQDWFQEVSVKGSHISDVFMGHRKFPHFVMAVKHEELTGTNWILRATIDTDKFNNLITSMGLDPGSDAFIINQDGMFQTASRFYGEVLQKFPFPHPPMSHEPNVMEMKDPQDRKILMAYTYFSTPSFVLVLIKPKSEVLKSWFTLKSEIFFIFIISVVVIFIVVFKISDALVKRIEESDMRRQVTIHEIEHTNKLASIGRLAAGVAHEVNNPLAIINEKAGLIEDLVSSMPAFAEKEKFLKLTESTRKSVERCSTITHRLLGFARRMEVEIEPLDINDIIREVFGFLEKEAFHRSIAVGLELAEDIPQILSDRGQLQQVFLNILNNAIDAVDDGGKVVITSWEADGDTVGVSVQDDGIGMSEETKKRIFEPFFSLRKGYGTGLGLSITYGIVKKLGGNIEVNSQLGEGTTFKVFLPKKAI